MSKVYTGATMSLDGFIAGPDESGFDLLFRWYGNGDVAVPTADPDMTMHSTPVSAEHFTGVMERTGALVVGRHLFDVTKGWGGNHPIGCPTVVVTHRPPPDDWPADAPFEFVEGVERAVARAKELAGDKVVAVNGGSMASQCLDAKLLDEVWVDLVPVLLGDGTPFFSGLANRPIVLDGPLMALEGKDVTHLRYTVRYDG
jgi:dihydrofolate reductase